MNYKKSSKKSNIPVSPARDKFNTILLILMFGSIITLVVLSFLAAVMSSYGRFQEGMSGLLIGTFFNKDCILFMHASDTCNSIQESSKK